MVSQQRELGGTRDEVKSLHGRRRPALVLLLCLTACAPSRVVPADGGAGPSTDLPKDREAQGAVLRFRADHPADLRQDRSIYASIEHFESAYPDTFWNAYLDTLPSNEEGRLAWEASRRFMALVVMYQSTGDARYLEHVWRYSLKAMESRDDRRGLLDSRNRSLPAWGSSRYMVGQRTNFLVHSGLILEPILEMLLALRGQLPLLSGEDVVAPMQVAWAPLEAQTKLLSDCLEAIDLYDDRFRVGLTEEEGFFLDDPSQWEPQPFNAQNVFAYDLQLAYLLSGGETYRDRARAVMQFFHNRLKITDQDGYIWEYVAWPISERPIPLEAYVVLKCEEISHGFVTVEPIPKMAHLGVVFDRADIGRFSRTLSRQIYNPNYRTFNTVVGCEASYAPHYIGRLPGWLCVTEDSPEAYTILEQFMLANVEHPDPLFLAYLIRFDPYRRTLQAPD